MDHYPALANSQLAMSILLNSAASDALSISRLGQQQQQRSALSSASLGPSSLTMLRLQRELVSRELASRSRTSELPLSLLRAAALEGTGGSSSRLFSSLPIVGAAGYPGVGGRQSTSRIPKPESMVAASNMSGLPSTSPAVSWLKRNHSDELARSTSGGSSTVAEQSNKKQKLNSGAAATGSPGGKAKIRDDFWGKVGKNNSHIHLVNIVLGRLLNDHVKAAKGGNKVLSNDFIQQILDTKLYGKFAVRDFFASSNKASETVRNTWTRLNFASDDIRKGLSRYKEQTWQAIERCDFEDVSAEDKHEMDEALKLFMQTGGFVPALDVALKGIITEQFMGVLMQLRLEWNSLCLKCRPEDHDSVVAGFLRCYGLNGK